MLIDNVGFFCLPPFITHATSHDSCGSVCGCRVVRCIVPWVHIQPYLCSSLIAFPPPLPPPRFLCSMQKKNRYPLINSKVVKILSSPKGFESSEEEMNRSLPPRNIKVEPSGTKSIIKKQTKQVLRLQHLKGYTQRSHDANDNIFLKSHDRAGNSVYTHNLVSSA